MRSCLVIGATSDQFSLGVSVCFRCGTSWKGKRKMQDERRALKGFRQNYSEFILSFWNNWEMSAYLSQFKESFNIFSGFNSKYAFNE